MSAAEFFFVLTGAVAVGSALSVVLSANTVHAALFLLVNLFSLAVLYLTLGADFLFAVQVLVYAGAILVLFMFVITLLNPAIESGLAGMHGRVVPAVALCAALLLEMLLVVRVGDIPAGRSGPRAGLTEIGEALFTEYLFPFEAVSVLLLAAVVGAMVLARRRGPERVARPDPLDEAVPSAQETGRA